MQSWMIVFLAVGYIVFLFALAAYGDRRERTIGKGRPRPIIYALSLAVYCTSWTFFGSIGVASERGFEYLGIFLGPILVFTFGMPILRRMMLLTKAERITSVADFIASRYGKNARVASIAALIAVIGTIPYIALQLKAIADSATLLTEHYQTLENAWVARDLEVSIFVTAVLSAFAILFGTRHADATEHQDGLILSVAVESLFKIVVFVSVGTAIVFFLFDGPGPVINAFDNNPLVNDAVAAGGNGTTWFILTILSASAIIVLPRQFHVTFVENRSEDELRKAGWMLPLYLIVINVLVLPIAISGMLYLDGSVSSDMYLIALPLAADHDFLAILTFIGGLSAATAMVIVACVALAVMISNDLIIPLLIWKIGDRLNTQSGDWANIILNIRRCAIIAVMFLAFMYHSIAQSNIGLASIGLVSFAALTQLMPALLLGLFWRGGNARGAVFSMVGGFAVWAYTLLLPSILGQSSTMLIDGPWGLAFLRPEALFYTHALPINHGVMWSLTVNIGLYFIGSMSREATSLERVQAISFIPREQARYVELRQFASNVHNGELKATLARYIGQERMERAFWSFEAREGRLLHNNDPADHGVVRYAEQTLASAIGASSARLILSLMLEKDGNNSNETVKLLDSASEAIQQNRDLLQTALDQLDQGISIFDQELCLTNWNGQFRRLLDLPPHLGQFGLPLKSIMDWLLDQGQLTPATHRQTMEIIPELEGAWNMHLLKSGRIIEVRSNSMPDGGIVVTYSDITAMVEAKEALQRAKQGLEARVLQRTVELTTVNEELAQARKVAEEANVGKTRFLAAAGHDITQPLNAARLYATSLVERMETNDSDDITIARKIDSALESVETIIGAVLDISRLDAGALKPSNTVFRLKDLLNQLKIDFQPMAREKNIDLRFVSTDIVINTDRNLLRRLLQNLISNAIKYTKSGRVLIGARRRGDHIDLHVYDTGIGIAPQKANSVFKEFERLQEGARISSGLGLGLSIVDRISKVLSLPVKMQSTLQKGTSFHIEIPVSNDKLTDQDRPDVIAMQPKKQLSGLIVACIDNEDDILAGMRVLLTGWGATVIAASDQKMLMREIAESKSLPHVILADYHLDNNVVGLDVIAAVRARLNPSMEAVLITADRSIEVKQEAIKHGITILNKPLKPAALRVLLSNVVVQTATAAE